MPLVPKSLGVRQPAAILDPLLGHSDSDFMSMSSRIRVPLVKAAAAILICGPSNYLEILTLALSLSSLAAISSSKYLLILIVPRVWALSSDQGSSSRKT